ncbi:hypothetical protein ZWY2020_003146 [Hordeum vulgare]|nr:hypothetical protein ZWY2020_003146 [Hordeum vulgare]
MPPDGPDCWPPSDNRRQWLVFSNLDGLTLRSASTIEGNGEEWWNLPASPTGYVTYHYHPQLSPSISVWSTRTTREAACISMIRPLCSQGPNGSTLHGPCDSPTLIRFFESCNLVVQGLRVENSPEFHFRFDGCSDVLVDGLFISSPANSPNTDGIHVENTERVGIYNSKISNGDDCISIRTGSYDVDIQNVTCGPGHGISIGSLGVHNSQACVANVTVRDAVIRNSDNGLRIKTWQGGMGSVSGITFDGVTMENVRNCIIIDQYYCQDKRCMNQSTAVHVTDVSYANVRAPTTSGRAHPLRVQRHRAMHQRHHGRGRAAALQQRARRRPYCWSADGAQQTPTIPPVSCLQDGVPDSLLDNPDLKCR